MIIDEVQKEAERIAEELAGHSHAQVAAITSLVESATDRRFRPAARNLEHWARQYILAVEREFGPQPKWGTGIVGNLRAACDETRAMLGDAPKHDWRESAYEAAREPEGT